MKKRRFVKNLPDTLDIFSGLSYNCIYGTKIIHQKGFYMKYRTNLHVCAQEDPIHGAK